MGGVYIAKSGLTLRGMNRSTVIVDGTKAGRSRAARAEGARTTARRGKKGVPVGRNGILVWKANDVSIENLTVCNFLAGTGASGNEVWWNGGDGSGKIGLHGYWSSYLTATSTFFSNETTAAEYGVFSSNSAGPADWNQLYASNMNDSGTYVGACKRSCDADPGPPVDGEQRARLLGHELRRQDRHRELAVRPQPGRPGHQQRGGRRSARAAGRQVPARPPARSPTPPRAG